MKKNILTIVLFLIPVLVHPATEDGIIISKISMKPLPFNERRDPVLDSPFNAFDGDTKSAALYSDFSMEFENPVTMDKIMFMNGNSSSKELFAKNNRLRDIEITLYTIDIKPDNNTEKQSEPKNESNSDIEKNSNKTEVDEKKDNKAEDNKEPNEKINEEIKDKNNIENKEENNKENKTPEKIVQNFNDYMSGDIKLYYVSETYTDEDKNTEKSETYADEDKSANKIELDKVMEKINTQVLGEKTEEDKTLKDKTENSKIDKKNEKKIADQVRNDSVKKGSVKKKPVTKKPVTKKPVTKKPVTKKNTNTKNVADKKETAQNNKAAESQTKISRIVKLDDDSEGRILVYISLKDSMEYQSIDLKTQYIVKRIDFRTMEDEYYKGTEPDRTAITEIAFSNKGKMIPFQDIDTLKQRYIENYNRVLKESVSNMNFVMYENNDITMRLEIKEDGSMEFIDRYKCKNKGDADCTSTMMPVQWRITDNKLYMRYHTIWRLWKYELDLQSDIINYTENHEPPRWMKIYFKSDNGFTDKYLDLMIGD